MAVTTMDLLELLRKADTADVDFLREGVRVLAQALMDAEVSAQIGAEHGQRSPARVTHRNGYRPRDWDTRVGTVELQVPRVREGSYLPSFLEPRRRAELELGAAEDGAAWTGFLRGLVARGLGGVKLVISDAHRGLVDAIASVLDGASWQRCRTHFISVNRPWE